MATGMMVLVLGVVIAGQRQTHHLLLEEIGTLKARVAELASAPSGPASVEGSASSPDPALAQELVSLRRDMAALREALAGHARAAAIPEAGSHRVNPIPPTATVPAFVKSGWVDAEGLPPAVLATLRDQLGNLPIEGANMKRSEGRQYYRVDTRLPDGRAVELSVNDQGQVVGRLVEMSLESLDPVIRQQAMGEVGSVPVRRVAEVFEDGKIRYQVVAKDENQAVNVMIAPDGTVLRTAVERRGNKS